MKTEERDEARTLRRVHGLSVKEIARRVGVSTSSVSRWVRDVPLTDGQRAALLAANPAYNRQLDGSAAMVARHRGDRERAQSSGRDLARRGEGLHLAGCMLYWAEGAKDRNQVCFSNSDPEMARLFVTFLLRYFDLEPEDIKLRCHLFADHVEVQREIERFWLEKLALPHSSLRTSIVNVYSRHSRRRRRNVLPYGTCRLVVTRTAVVQSIFGAIQEYAGFRRDSWLE